MATKGKSTKSTSTRKKVNNTVSKKISDATGVKKSYVSKQVNQVSKLKFSEKLVVVLFLFIGIAAGYFGVSFIQKNDQFRLVNGETYCVNVNEEIDLNDLSKYVVCVSYGRNVISSVSVEGIEDKKLDTSKEQTYVITYVSSDIKYKNIKLSQTIIVSDSENSYEE